MDSGSAAAAAAAAAAAPTAAVTGSPTEQRRTTGARPRGTAGRPSFGQTPPSGSRQLGVEVASPCGLPSAPATRGEAVSPHGLAIPRVRIGTPLSGAGRPTSPHRPPGAKPERPGLAALLFDRNPTSSHRHQRPPPRPSVQPATRSSPSEVAGPEVFLKCGAGPHQSVFVEYTPIHDHVMSCHVTSAASLSPAVVAAAPRLKKKEG